MKRLVALVCALGCSPASTDVIPADAAAEAAFVEDSFADAMRDIEGFGVDTGDANCSHDLCVDFDNGRYGPLGTMPGASDGGSFALDPDARSKPNCLRTTVPSPTGIVATSNLYLSLSSEAGTARFRFAMKLDPVTFDAAHTGRVILGRITLEDVKGNLLLMLTSAGLVLDVSYYRPTDGGWTIADLPARTFTKPPPFGAWVDVELSLTATADGSRAVAIVNGETITVDVPPSVTAASGMAQFGVGLHSVRPAPAMTARFDDLLIDVGK